MFEIVVDDDDGRRSIMLACGCSLTPSNITFTFKPGFTWVKVIFSYFFTLFLL